MPADTRVLYNADCPVCNAEIGHYARLARAHRLPVRFDDLNTDARRAWGIDADTAARRLHVLHAGDIHSGLEAFRILWAQMPRYRWLSKLTGLPGVRALSAATYDHLLAPWLYRRHMRRVHNRRAATHGSGD